MNKDTDRQHIDWLLANRSTPHLRLGERERMLLIMRLSVGNPDPGDDELCAYAYFRNEYYELGGTEADPTLEQMCEAVINNFISKRCN